jgi:hypothetical protein
MLGVDRHVSNVPPSDSCTAAKAPIASIAMRGMKMLNEIARNKLDEAAARPAHRESLHGDKVREGSAALGEKRLRRF